MSKNSFHKIAQKLNVSIKVINCLLSSIVLFVYCKLSHKTSLNITKGMQFYDTFHVHPVAAIWKVITLISRSTNPVRSTVAEAFLTFAQKIIFFFSVENSRCPSSTNLFRNKNIYIDTS